MASTGENVVLMTHVYLITGTDTARIHARAKELFQALTRRKIKEQKASEAGVEKGNEQEASEAGVEKGNEQEASEAGVEKGNEQGASEAGVEKGNEQEASEAGVEKDQEHFRILNDFLIDTISEGDESPASQMLSRVISSLREPPFMKEYDDDDKVIWLKRFNYFDAGSSKSDSSQKDDSPKDGKKSAPKKPRKRQKPGEPPEIEFDEDEPDTMGVRALAKFLYKFKRPTPEGSAPTPDPRPEFPHDIYLLLEGTGCAPDSPLGIICQDLGQVEEYSLPSSDAKTPRPRDWEKQMDAMISSYASQKGINISKEARTALVNNLGWNATFVDQELEKLVCYMGDNGATPISEEAVQLLGSVYDAPENWSLGDPVGARNLSLALAITEKIVSVSRKPLENARMMLYALAKQFRYYMALRLCLAEMRFSSGTALANHLNALDPAGKRAIVEKYGEAVAGNPWRIKHLADQCMNYTPQEMLRAIQRLRDVITAINSGGISSELLALENFLCQTLPKEGIRP